MTPDPIFARQREGASLADLCGEFHMTPDDVVGILTHRCDRKRVDLLIRGEREKKRQRFQNRGAWLAQKSDSPCKGHSRPEQETADDQGPDVVSRLRGARDH